MTSLSQGGGERFGGLVGPENIHKYNEDKDKDNMYEKQGTCNNVCLNETKDLIAHIYILIMADI